MRYTLLALLAAAALCAQPRSPLRQVFTERCAGCHGDAMQGARAGALTDAMWTYGGTDEAILTSIRDGRADAGMPSFKDSLSDTEIRGLLLLIRGQATQAAGRPATRATDPSTLPFTMETIVDALETPWSLVFLPDGRMLVSERPGRLRIAGVGAPVSGTPVPWVRQDAGFFDIEVHPNYAENGWIYLAYAEAREGNRSMTTILRGRIRDNAWVDEQTIFRAPDELFSTTNFHYGLRFIFDRDGYLYYSLGDKGNPAAAQDLSSPLGKIHRVFDDGRIPPDNPFVNREGAVGSIWTYGHRNPQGFAFLPTGEMLASEHGPNGGDEVNVIVKGHNYGWPVVSFGLMDNGLPTAATSQPGMDAPIAHWEPSPGVSALLVQGQSVLLGSMGHEELKRLIIDTTGNGTRVVREETVFRGLGRVRDIVLGPDGAIYLALAEPGPQLFATTRGRIVRLMPRVSVP